MERTRRIYREILKRVDLRLWIAGLFYRVRHIVYKDLSVRVHHCPRCGLKINRDLNAALNILRLGQQSVEYRAFAAMRLEHG